MATEFVGNGHAVTMLHRVSERSTLPHAWLFAGPSQVGKRTLALRWAQWLNCAAPQASLTPCGRCRSCRHVDPDRSSYANTHPSILLVDTWMAAYWEAAEKAKEGEPVDTTKLKPKLSVGVGAVRLVREQVSAAPAGRWRVVIVDEAERLTDEAAAALLKTLEEPPERTLLILVSANPWALPATVRSRCQPVRFRLVPTREIVAALRRHGAPDREADRLARLARGRIGWAFNALRDAAWREQHDHLWSLLHLMVTMEAWDVFRFAELCTKGVDEDEGDDTPLAAQRRQLEARLEHLMLGWRDLCALAWGADDLVVNADRADELRRWGVTAEQAVSVLQRLRQTLRAIRPPLNANPQLALEVLALETLSAGRPSA
ncbi:DNA polymerase III subunit gamma/tau [bacterium HR17]|uniref:DNA polymerase III subunit gamma/tau n=1 Tax=Candidatus Fervidibacter japonicus TaxID=2035412 RepID=A0A2H5XCY5_9BACT|nr:DNA polymerase III subunit gamma/tau [bacterium HR17]